MFDCFVHFSSCTYDITNVNAGGYDDHDRNDFFAAIMIVIGLYLTRRAEWRIYPTEGYYAGRLAGRRKQIYQILWFVAAVLALVWRPWMAYSFLFVLVVIFPFLLERD
jgi:hypothetical protein